MNAQLPLALPAGPDQRFETFVGADLAVTQLHAAAQGKADATLLLEGPSGCGKTHLLLATCAEAQASGRAARYVPLAAWSGGLGSLLEETTLPPLLALDGVEAVAESADDCVALFHLHNRARDAGSVLLYASQLSPAALPLALPDLRSRLSQCLRLPLELLDDDGRREALRRRAARRGLELDDAVLDYLFRRVERDLKSLTVVLDRLDRASLAAQRRLTVPLLRQVLDQG